MDHFLPLIKNDFINNIVIFHHLIASHQIIILQKIRQKNENIYKSNKKGEYKDGCTVPIVADSFRIPVNKNHYPHNLREK